MAPPLLAELSDRVLSTMDTALPALTETAPPSVLLPCSSVSLSRFREAPELTAKIWAASPPLRATGADEAPTLRVRFCAMEIVLPKVSVAALLQSRITVPPAPASVMSFISADSVPGQSVTGPVGVSVGVIVGVAVGAGVLVVVGTGVSLGAAVGVSVGVGIGVSVGVAVGVAVEVAAAVGVGV